MNSKAERQSHLIGRSEKGAPTEKGEKQPTKDKETAAAVPESTSEMRNMESKPTIIGKPCESCIKLARNRGPLQIPIKGVPDPVLFPMQCRVCLSSHHVSLYTPESKF
jgi:hypothetical protein